MVALADKKWFRTLLAFIFVFLLIYLISLSDYIFDPIWTFIKAVAIPIIGAGVLFYITRPVMHYLMRHKVNKVVAIVLVFLLITALIALFITYIAPILQQQFIRLANNLPEMGQTVQDWFNRLQNNQQFIPQQFEGVLNDALTNLGSQFSNLSTMLVNFITGLISLIFAVVLIPFFLFFMLKDGNRLVPYLSQFMSKSKANSFRRLMEHLNTTLESFILGQFIVSVCVGIMLYIGYIIIGLQYSLTLALLAVVLNVIPFAGPILATIPAIIVAFFQSPMDAVWVVVVMVIAQQIEGNLISPNVMGRVLHLHPLTIITLILAAGAIAGFVGIILAVPFYAVVKTIISHFYNEWQKTQPDGEKEIL